VSRAEKARRVPSLTFAVAFVLASAASDGGAMPRSAVSLVGQSAWFT
jgi:hypothetical protein